MGHPPHNGSETVIVTTETRKACTNCGRKRPIHAYLGDWPHKPVCGACAPILQLLERFRIEALAARRPA